MSTQGKSIPGNGGRRPGAGRKPSSSTVRTREVAERLAKDGRLTPLEYLVRVMRNSKAAKEDRLEAAKATLAYFHPKMPTILEHSGKVDGGFALSVRLGDSK